MNWQLAADSGVDAEQAARAGTQAGMFLTQAVHGEVDGAVLDPVEVLIDPHSTATAVYALAAVQGPIRAYLATAWGGSEHVAAKQIVSYPTIDQARQAKQTILAQRLGGHSGDRHYVQLGTFQSDTDGKEVGT